MTVTFIGKVIKIGSSLGVIIPKKQLDAMRVKVGDEVVVEFRPISKS